ncbi:MAG TPA: iron-sulfur cluster assembly scaffold protein [Syntrophorhabdaceae bacterium]|nr:iron-sulfur cluster assembly scaffold protein [Syntrophorhabdaceae bacterium]HOL06148.1 iron-sulfur cluster assembly scaffold protein [Syntrophorhabdaceae bacterium]HON86447.1 iron-sulfur cluster assembly scaffold protein [Syntrophorhabdaceae bacterium]HOT42836.1 iron-sulfur cluster assembly scaffold protein [Syntrophorhabdaceae bacterium]HPC67714.1 iron-sulfur cluster assembly scaffold protein [Syntrophorhabdaceae bacterium]
MNIYTKKVLEHFKNPKNAGVIEDPDGIGEIGDPDCGDFLRVFIKVDDNTIRDVKYQIRGCPASIACASAMTEMAKGKNLDDAMMITDDDIVNELDGLPEFKIHCSALAATGLQKAIIDYFERYINKAQYRKIKR